MNENVPVPPSVMAKLPIIGANAFVLWVFMRSYADNDGNVIMSYDVISEGTGLKSTTTISAAIKTLVIAGLLVQHRNYSAATTYQIVIPLENKGLSQFSSPLENAINEGLETNSIKSINNDSLINKEPLKPLDSKGLENSPSIPLENKGLTVNAFQRMNDFQQAEYIYQQVTGMLAIPTRNREVVIDNIGKMLKEFGPDETVRRMTESYQAWTGKRTKDGRMYSKLNTGWIDWAITGEIPGVTDAPPDPMAELYARYPLYRASDPQ